MSDDPMEKIQSLDSIIESIKQYGASGIDISPHLSAIQSLNGDTPSEKYKHFNTIVKEIVTKAQHADIALKFIEESEEIPTALKSLMKIYVANELKVHNVILEALMSEDKTILNQALKATWFFDNANPILQADYFVKHVLPRLPDLTRHKIIKILSKTLIGAEKNAESLYDALVDLYSFKEALPLLPACSQGFIFNQIMKRKLLLSHETLIVLYKKYPSLVIRYLNLGNFNDKSNVRDRNIHSINISNHKKFIPHLIRNDVYYFLVFKRICDYGLPIGKTRTALFFKRAVNEVVNNPTEFLQIWPMKIISKKITIQQFETMFSNLFPEKRIHFHLWKIVDYLRYYPQEKRLDLLSRLYKLKYSVEILDGIKEVDQRDLDYTYDLLPLEFFEKLYVKRFPEKSNSFNINTVLHDLRRYPAEKKFKFVSESFGEKYNADFFENVDNIRSTELLELLPHDVREKEVARLIDLCEKKSDEYYKWYTYMPLENSFPVFKDAISECSLWSKRCEFVKKMLNCCKLSERKEDLIRVLKYYIERHKNERTDFLFDLLRHFESQFDPAKLDREIWHALYEIIQIAHVKGELVRNMFYILSKYFNAVIHFILTNCKNEGEINPNQTDEIFLNKIFDITADFIIDTAAESQISSIYEFSIQRYSLDKLVNSLTIKYTAENPHWQGKKGMLKRYDLAEGILCAFSSYNNQCVERLKNKTYFGKPLIVSDYPWLVEMTRDVFNSDLPNDSRWSKTLYNFKRLLKKTDMETYENITGQMSTMDDISVYELVDIKSGAAWNKLKKNPQHVLDNWIEYFIECRNRLKKNSKFGGAAAKRFLLTLKWYGTLPSKFIERSFLEIKEIGSIKILGVLLENEVFSKVIVSLAPPESSLNISNLDSKNFYKMVQSASQAMNLTNPLISFDTILLFCVGDYLKLAIEAFTYVSQRISKTKIMIFAESLIKKSVSVKKQGVKLIFKAATETELQQFIRNIWCQESHKSIRELIAEMVKDRLENYPNDTTWELLETCLQNLNANDEVLVKMFCENPIKNKYSLLYLDLIIKKIETLYGNELPELEEKYLCLLFKNIKNGTIKYLTEESILAILEKYYFETESVNIHSAVAVFAHNVFQRLQN